VYEEGVTPIRTAHAGAVIGQYVSVMSRREPGASASPSVGSQLSGDRPLRRPAEDRLGIAPFARNLAEGLLRFGPTGGFVVALYGAWGSGKSTVLNFVQFYLEEEHSEEDVLVVPFNPWWFSGQEDLTTRFLEQLLAIVEPKQRRRTGEIRKKFATFAGYVSEGPSIIGTGGRVAARALQTDAPNIHDLKDELGGFLQERVGRIVVLIDDTDRLTQDEIRQLFRLIKAVADFPNVTYLIALDQTVAREALAQDFGGRAHDYLEKIVQLPYELPMPERPDLRAFFLDKLDALYRAVEGPVQLEEAYWMDVFFDAVDPFLATPRDVTRLINVLQATFPPVAGEVNFADFVAMSALQTFHSTVWDVIRRNQAAFAGPTTTSFATGRDELERLGTWYDEVLAECIDEEAVPRVDSALKRVFPKYGGVRSGTHLGSDWEARWRRERRVASAMVFPLYFQQAPPPGHLSRAELNNLFVVACDEEAFGAELLRVSEEKQPDGSTRLPAYLEQLRDYADEVPDECREPAVRALFDMGDRLLIREDAGGGLFGQGNDIRIMQALYRLLRSVSETERYALIRDAIRDGAAIATAAHEVAVYAQEHGEMDASGRPEPDRTVSAEHLGELKQLIVEKIRRAAEDGSLLQTRDLGHLLYRWQDWGDEEEPRTWVTGVAAEDRGLIRILEAFLGESRTQGSEGRFVTRAYRLDPKAIEPFLPTEDVIDRVRKLVERTDLDEREHAAVEMFLRGYEMRLRGEDPNW
jgi:predicted KAP-like P-loop ATPase